MNTPTYSANLKYYKGDVYFKYGQYSNGNLAIQVFQAEDHSPAFKASVNFIDEVLKEGEVVIKTYSENEGVLEFLQQNKIVGEVIREVDNGFVKCPVVNINPDIMVQLKQDYINAQSN